MKEFPKFIYGTAWKENQTANLVELALESGFRAIDTANQAKHYSEPLVGKALLNAEDSGISRDQIWLQSKFTSIDGQDETGFVPYGENDNLFDQVIQSFASSLDHLHTDYLDSYLLHGPLNHPLLGPEDFEIWEAMEEIFDEGLSNIIGVSNVNINQLELLYENARVAPMTVQNRCFANTGWDKEVREFCKNNNIYYQGFSLLTANVQIFENEELLEIAKQSHLNPAQIIFRFAQQIGMTPLTGTTNADRMKMDLEISKFKLTQEEIEFIENIDW